MGELVDALVRVLEFVVQGALAVLLFGFVLSWVHGVKDSVYKHARDMTEYMLGKNWKALKPHPNVLVAIIIGMLYVAGVITNSVGYWLLDPAHELVIASAVPAPQQKKVSPQNQAVANAALSTATIAPTSVPVSQLVGIVVTRVLMGASYPEKPEYVNYIDEEVAWRNKNLDAVKHALDPLLKQSRVIRGTAVISLGFLIVSVAKAISFLLCLILLSLPGRFQNVGEWLYRRIVYPNDATAHRDRSGDHEVPKRKTTASYALSNMIYATIAFGVLWCSLGAYATTEREYHLMAHAGGTSVSTIK